MLAVFAPTDVGVKVVSTVHEAPKANGAVQVLVVGNDAASAPLTTIEVTVSGRVPLFDTVTVRNADGSAPAAHRRPAALR